MRIRLTWMVGYEFKRDELFAARGVEPEVRPSDDLPGWSGPGWLGQGWLGQGCAL